MGLVEEHLPNELEKFSSMGLIKDGIYKRVEFAIEDVFDICAIINADLELGVPCSDEDIAENLVKNGILSNKMREKLKAMRGFRNIVVHRYGRIDDKLAFEILRENIEDFYEFIKKIEEFLGKWGYRQRQR